MRTFYLKIRELFLWQYQAYIDWKTYIWDVDIDSDFVCCNGKDCACGGLTVRQSLKMDIADLIDTDNSVTKS